MKFKLLGLMVWQLIIVIILILAGSYAIWAKNEGTSTPWHLNSVGCPGDKISILEDDGKTTCIKPFGSPNMVNCQDVPNGAFYSTPDGGSGRCFNGQQMPTFSS
jgi:hypothetical protein